LPRALSRALRLVVAVPLIVSAGCASRAPLRVAPPAELYDEAEIPGLPDVRGWGDDFGSEARAQARESLTNAMVARWEAAGRPPGGIELELLALSGGGPDGAFAAGLLNGWSARGDRPEFETVTGISVGALIAPFAFLGPAYDDELREIFTTSTTGDVIVFRFFGALMGALGVADPQPLRQTLRRLVDERMLAAIAAEHRKGRRLLIGTTNIDAQRPVIWNMGAIAEAGELRLFQDVMVASASIPGAFPPVLIDVEAQGQRFTEFHVDGGVTHSVIIGPTGIQSALPRGLPFPLRREIYVIQNNSLLPVYSPVESRLTAIGLRSFSTLIRAQSSGDLTAIYLAANEVGAGFNLLFVPPGFSPASAASFDPVYMQALFDRAYADALDGIDWLDQPPGVVTRSEIVERMGPAAALSPAAVGR
jgi:predicted acylesterase/phospholipase RssA